MTRWAVLHTRSWRFDDLDWCDGAGAQSATSSATDRHGTFATRQEAEAELRIWRWQAPPFEDWYVAEVDE